MPRFVPALAGDFHAQRPGRIGKFGDAGRGHVDARHFVRHVAVDHLAAGDLRKVAILRRISVTSDDLETGIACRRFAQGDILDLVESKLDHADTCSATMLPIACSRAAIAVADGRSSLSSLCNSAASSRCRSNSRTMRSMMTTDGSSRIGSVAVK